MLKDKNIFSEVILMTILTIFSILEICILFLILAVAILFYIIVGVSSLFFIPTIAIFKFFKKRKG